MLSADLQVYATSLVLGLFTPGLIFWMLYRPLASFLHAIFGQAEIEHKLLPLLGVALILALVTALVKPVLVVLSFPVILLTLGLFLIVVNAILLLITDWLADLFDVGFHVTGFWPAVGGAIIISITTWVLDALVGVEEEA